MLMPGHKDNPIITYWAMWDSLWIAYTPWVPFVYEWLYVVVTPNLN